MRVLEEIRGTLWPSAGDRHGPLPPLLVTLTVVTGLVDAASYLKLGHVFVANMTGNVVFLGFALAGASGLSAGSSLVALGAFLFGALGGGWLGGRNPGHRGRMLRAAGFAQAPLMAAALLVAALGATPPDRGVRLALIALLALAMGVQNAAAQRLAVPELTTSVLTKTLDRDRLGGRHPGRNRLEARSARDRRHRDARRGANRSRAGAERVRRGGHRAGSLPGAGGSPRRASRLALGRALGAPLNLLRRRRDHHQRTIRDEQALGVERRLTETLDVGRALQEDVGRLQEADARSPVVHRHHPARREPLDDRARLLGADRRTAADGHEQQVDLADRRGLLLAQRSSGRSRRNDTLAAPSSSNTKIVFGPRSVPACSSCSEAIAMTSPIGDSSLPAVERRIAGSPPIASTPL